MGKTIRERLGIVETKLDLLEKQNREDHQKMISSLEDLKNFKIKILTITSTISAIIAGIITWLK